MRRGLTIGQAAAFAEVTVKTVRHYHRLGLLAEPDRDSSGYRRYTSGDLLRLVQVRTLAGAGVPLAEIDELLDADPDRFAANLADVERRLTERIDRLVERRATLHRLADGDRALLPDRACALLRRMADLGFDADYVDAQREGLVLVRALVPDGLDEFLSLLEQRLADPVFVELSKRTWRATSWEPDDPRLDALAAAVTDNLLHHLPEAPPAGFQGHTDARERVALINRHREEELPTLARLGALIEAKLREAGVDVPYR